MSTAPAYVALVLLLAILCVSCSLGRLYQPASLVPVSFLDGRHEKPR